MYILAMLAESLKCSSKLTICSKCTRCNNFNPKKYQIYWRSENASNDRLVEEAVSYYVEEKMKPLNFLRSSHNIAPIYINSDPTTALYFSVIHIRLYWRTFLPNRLLLPLHQILLQWHQLCRSIVFEVLWFS